MQLYLAHIGNIMRVLNWHGCLRLLYRKIMVHIYDGTSYTVFAWLKLWNRAKDTHSSISPL